MKLTYDLFKLLGLATSSRHREHSLFDTRDLVKIMVPAEYIYQALTSIGTSRKGRLKLSTISSILGISWRRARNYLDDFSYGDTTLFNKVMDRRVGLLKDKVEYGLSDYGKRIYNTLLPRYGPFKNFLIKLITKLFCVYNPKYLIFKLSLIDLILLPLTLVFH